MAMIESVIVPTVSLLHRNTKRAQERITPGSSSGFSSVSCGACKEQHKQFPIFIRASNCVDLEHVGFRRSGRILGRCWKGWTRTILSVAERSRRFRVCSTGVGCGGRVSAVAEEIEVMEGDVVEYPLAADPGVAQEEGNDNGRRVGVGVIVDLFQESDGLLCQIEPLCQEDPRSKEWIHDELQPEITVPIGKYWQINVFLSLMHENNKRLAQEVLRKVLTAGILDSSFASMVQSKNGARSHLKSPWRAC